MPKERSLWLLIALMFIAFGVNKQLDLQTAFTEAGPIVAITEGWYAERQIVQIWFIAGVAIICILIGVGLLLLAWDASIAARVALAGMVAVLAFVLVRAASFHHIDRFTGERILGLKWNWVLEMGGISLVLLSSEWRRRNLE